MIFNRKDIAARILWIKSQLLLKRTKIIRALKKSIISPALLLLVKKLHISQLAGEHSRGAPIDLESFARMARHEHLIIVFPNLFWNFRWQRPQQLVSQMSDDGYPVLFVSPKTQTVTMSNVTRYRKAETMWSVLSLRKLVAGITLHTKNERFILNDTLAEAEVKEMTEALVQIVMKVAKTWSASKKVTLLVQHPHWQPLIETLKATLSSNVIFDLMDNHSGFDQATKETVSMELQLLKRSDNIIVSSTFLKEYARKHSSNVTIVRNAADYNHFSVMVTNGELDCLTDKPIVGYFGALNNWFDMDLLSKVAITHPQWNFVLIGSISPCDFSPVEKLRNVYFLGEKHYSKLPGYLSYFDVCIIPFKLNPLTLATNPVKFYEYLSMGKQTVSTTLPELVPFSKYCYLADNDIDFAKGISISLQRNKSKLANKIYERNRKLAKRNTWERRWLKLKKLI